MYIFSGLFIPDGACMCLLCICRQELPSNCSEKKIQEATAILMRDVALTKEFQGCSITDYKGEF